MARVAEGKPWERENSDHSTNYGSYEFQAAAGMADLAFEVLAAQITRQNGGKVDGADGQPPVMTKVRFLARLLMAVADEAQAHIRADGCVDRMDASHTRARGALRTAIEVLPPPLGATDDQREAWRQQLVDTTIGLLDVAADVYRIDPQDYRPALADTAPL